VCPPNPLIGNKQPVPHLRGCRPAEVPRRRRIKRISQTAYRQSPAPNSARHCSTAPHAMTNRAVPPSRHPTAGKRQHRSLGEDIDARARTSPMATIPAEKNGKMCSRLPRPKSGRAIHTARTQPAAPASTRLVVRHMASMVSPPHILEVQRSNTRNRPAYAAANPLATRDMISASAIWPLQGAAAAKSTLRVKRSLQRRKTMSALCLPLWPQSYHTAGR